MFYFTKFTQLGYGDPFTPKYAVKSITRRALFKDQCHFPVLLKSLESIKKVIIYWYTSQVITNTSIKFRLFLGVRLHISCTQVALCSYTCLNDNEWLWIEVSFNPAACEGQLFCNPLDAQSRSHSDIFATSYRNK